MVKSAKLVKMAISRPGITRMERNSPEKFSVLKSPLAKSQQSMKTIKKNNETKELKLLFSRLREIVPTCTASSSSNTTVVVEAAKYICKLQSLLQLQAQDTVRHGPANFPDTHEAEKTRGIPDTDNRVARLMQFR